jgi:hypothetical protein
MRHDISMITVNATVTIGQENKAVNPPGYEFKHRNKWSSLYVSLGALIEERTLTDTNLLE